jgi:quinol monooxygenase YgiN
MLVTISKIYTRPDTSVPWHYEVLDSSEFLGQFHKIHAIHCTMNERIDIDELHIMFISQWESDEACQAYLDDPILNSYWQIRDDYNEIAGITSEERVVERT